MNRAAQFSRRDLFRRLFRPRTSRPLHPSSRQTGGTPTVAVVQGRFCLAYRSSFCSVCSERCPVPGALATERGLPRVDAALCTGCGVCHEVCPAPRNAILMIQKPSPNET